MIPDIIQSTIILRAVVGSTVHGLAIEGTDDRDEMGVYLEPPENVIGLQSHEYHIERTQPEGVRSGPGDLDLALYSLRKWMRLAIKGNPSILLLLFAPPMTCTPLGQELLDARELIISRQAGLPFMGYLKAQKEQMLGIRGGKHTNRLELVEAYGYDTKFMSHAIRLGYQGVELMQTGKITLPMPEPWKQEIRDVRQGRTSFEDAMTLLDAVETRLLSAVSESKLRSHPDYKRIDQLLISLYLRQWGWL